MILRLYKVLIILSIIEIINSRRISKNADLNLDGLSLTKSVETEDDAMKYLDKFGYMDNMKKEASMNSSEMRSVINDYQRFMGLSETGILDEKTMHMMNMPRCGVADNLYPRTKGVSRRSSKRRYRRYQLQGSAWPVKNITWKVTKYSDKESLRGKEKEIDAIMQYALDEWSKHCQLNFIHEKGYNKPMIEIGFLVREHRDGNPFDGPGKTLAHAFFPRFGGATHFDDQESWSIDGGRGVDLLSVAVHEFGHALGLGHSDDKESLMYPTYAGKRYRLKRDDINGIEMLYGKRRDIKEPTYLDRNENKVPDVNFIAPDLCKDFRIDAADCNTLGECFFFRDEYIWRINDDTSLHAGYPKLISDIFPGLSGKIDAAVTDDQSGLTYIFKGDRVWIYNRPMKDAVSTNQLISTSIRGLNATHFDAATVWGFNGKVYLYKDNQYWRFDTNRKLTPISRRYPYPLRIWRGLPQNIDAAMYWPKTKRTYFFKGPYYYRFNDFTSSVDQANPPFPREASKWWLKCEKDSLKDTDLTDNEIQDDLQLKCARKKNCKSIEGRSKGPRREDKLSVKSIFSFNRFMSALKKLFQQK